MEVRYPNYYKKFHCIAGDCPDTCCAGWEIPVDRASEKRYQEAQKSLKHAKPDFAKKLKKYIKGGQIISEDVTCPFLNRDGLCEMYIELGPDALCNACKRHPRHIEDYGNLHEMVLLLSCPEVARLVLEENEGGYYVRHLPERHGDMEGIDVELLDLLLTVREVIWNIAKEKTMSISQRMAYALALGHDVQRRIHNGNRNEIPNVLKKYEGCGAAERFLLQCEKKDSFSSVREALLAAFTEMETIYRQWPQLMEKWRTFSEYANAERNLKDSKSYEKSWENIFAYYIYSFLLSALYDEDLLTKIKMAVCCTLVSMELLAAELFAESGNKQTLEADKIQETSERRTLQNVCYAVARQIENSGENRNALERILKTESFMSRKIISFLQE